MRKVNLMFSLGRFSICVVGYAFLFVLVFGGYVFGQQTKTLQAGRGTVIRIAEPIPDVSNSCVTVECNWWRDLRKAGGDLQQTGKAKSKRKFVEIFLAGLENNYRVPIADRAPLLLSNDGPPQFQKGIRIRNGEVEISIEVRVDGSVGEIKVINGLDSMMNNICVQGFKEAIYLPAIRNGSWAADSVKTTCKYWSQNGY